MGTGLGLFPSKDLTLNCAPSPLLSSWHEEGGNLLPGHQEIESLPHFPRGKNVTYPAYVVICWKAVATITKSLKESQCQE